MISRSGVQVRSILQVRPEWRALEACDGLQAVQMAIELRRDIVLLDMRMPFLNGIEAAERIREEFPDSRVIFLTQSNDDAEVRTAALATGAERYLLKSNVVDELLSPPWRDSRLSRRTSLEVFRVTVASRLPPPHKPRCKNLPD